VDEGVVVVVGEGDIGVVVGEIGAGAVAAGGLLALALPAPPSIHIRFRASAGDRRTEEGGHRIEGGSV